MVSFTFSPNFDDVGTKAKSPFSCTSAFAASKIDWRSFSSTRSSFVPTSTMGAPGAFCRNMAIHSLAASKVMYRLKSKQMNAPTEPFTYSG